MLCLGRMPSTVVVFGSGGQLGRELVREFQGRGSTVAALDRTHVDITDAARVDAALAEHNPSVVFNAAAYNQVDVAEGEPLHAYSVNGLAVRNIAVACRQLDARFVHFSTDYVFDGTKRRPYTEDDPTHPLGAYAVSKLAGNSMLRPILTRP